MLLEETRTLAAHDVNLNVPEGRLACLAEQPFMAPTRLVDVDEDPRLTSPQETRNPALMRYALTVVLIALTGCSQAPTSFPSGNALARSCATLVSCFDGGASMRRCVSLETDVSPSVLTCLGNAGGDCDRALACVGASVLAAPTCAERQATCEGDTAVICLPPDGATPSYSLRADCAFHGETCVDGSCEGVPCTGGARCEGNTLVQCSVRERRVDCPSDTRCDAAAGTCVPAGPPCTDNVCDGDVIVRCYEGRSQRIDCASIGQACVAADGFVQCAPTGTECDDSFVTSCVSGILEYCGANNTIETFDCAANGFSGCAADPTRCVGRGLSGG